MRSDIAARNNAKKAEKQLELPHTLCLTITREFRKRKILGLPIEHVFMAGFALGWKHGRRTEK